MFGQSFFSVKRLGLIVGLIAILGIGATLISAASSASINLINLTDYEYSFVPSANDEGSGRDRVMVVCFDENFVINDTDRSDEDTSGTLTFDDDDCSFGDTVAVCMYDIVADIPENDYTPEVLAQIAAGPIIAQDGGACGFGSPAGAGTAGIFDGRLNWGDLGASAAIYCHQGGYRVYEIGDDGRGTLVMELTRDEVGAAMAEAAADGANVLVRTESDVQFWVLAPGDKFYQVVSPEVNEPGKMYNFVGELIC